MGKIIKHPAIIEKQNNINQLKALIDKYIPEKKKFVMDKIKQEQ